MSLIKLAIMTITISIGICYAIYLSIGIAFGAEFGVAEFEPAGYIKAREGEMYVALMETNYSINKKRTQASATITIHDYLHKPVVGAKVIVQWSTRNGKTNYCTTRTGGKCTLRNKTATTRSPEPILLKVLAVEHPELSWFSVESWQNVWVICPDGLCD